MLTEADCHANIRKSEVALSSVKSQKEEQEEMAKIMIWDRILYHVREGRTVTLNSENCFQLWDNNIPS
jgi:hypothetical protein